MDYLSLIRQNLVKEIYDGLSDEDKRTFMQITLQDNRYRDVMQKLNDIERKQSWFLDLGANVAGNVIYDGFLWLLKRIR